MKKIFNLFCIAAIAATALSCSKKELQAPVQPDQTEFTEVEFAAEMAAPTKATLTPDAEEATFTPAWENTDAIRVSYMGGSAAGVIEANWNGTGFSGSLPEYKGEWLYYAAYPAPDALGEIHFGSARTQDGNAYNSASDLMEGEAYASNAEAGKDNDGNPIVFTFARKTAIAYFHFTSDNTSETIEKATLSVEGGYISNSGVSVNESGVFTYASNTDADKTIELTFTNAPSAADFQLWFNVDPTSYTSMSLTVETATKTYTITKSAAGSYVAGKLYKVKKNGIVWTSKSAATTKVLTFDFVTKPSGWPTAKGDAASGSYTYTLDEVDYTFTHTKSGDGIYCGGTSGTSGYLLVASGNDLGLPALAGYKLTEVLGTLNGSGTPSTSSVVAITDGTNELTGGDGQTWGTKGGDYYYDLSDTEENTVYYASVSNKNCQIITLVLTYEPATPSTPKTPQTLTFPEDSYTITFGDSFTAPTVSGANTKVEYTSSNTSVATVNAETGAVTVLAAGSTTITATAEADATYAKGVAYYELTVNPNTTLTTIDAIYSKAVSVGTTGENAKVALGSWVVSGVKGSNAYVTDGTKGFIVYGSGHGFEVGDILSGTVNCKVQIFNGSAELTNLTTSTTGLTVTKGGTITPKVVSISDLSGVNTGAPIILNGVTFDGTNLSDGEGSVKPYTTLYSYPSGTFANGVKYNVTGIYLQYNSTKEILPREASDIEEVPATKYAITISSGIANGTVTASLSEAAEGVEVTLTATPESGYKFKSWNVTYGGSNSITVTDNKFTMPAAAVTVSATFEEIIGGEPVVETFDLRYSTTDTKSADWSIAQNGTTLFWSKGSASNTPSPNKEGSVRMYTNTTLTITAPTGKVITKIDFTPMSSTYSATNLKYSGVSLTSDSWTLSSPVNSVVLTASANARFKEIKVTYE